MNGFVVQGHIYLFIYLNLLQYFNTIKIKYIFFL